MGKTFRWYEQQDPRQDSKAQKVAAKKQGRKEKQFFKNQAG